MLKTRVLAYLTKPLKAKDISEIRAYVDARDVGILFTEDSEGMKSFGLIEKELVDDQKNIFPLMRVTKPSKEKVYNFPFFINKDISLLGKIKSETLLKYTERSLDMLLILDERPDVITQYIISKCQCPLRIGCSSGADFNSEMLNFIVKPKNEEKKHRALMEYLRMIS